MDEQGNDADLLEPDPRRGDGSKGDVTVSWGCETFAYQAKTFDDTACPFASVGLEDSCSGEALG